MRRNEQMFVKDVYAYYAHSGRRTLPWRKTKNPYHILVSEIMLQQTQVDRVIPYYGAFIKQFPSFDVLARASLGEVMRAWQGLGYNRRARMLHACARDIVRIHKNHLPKSHSALMELPGVGHYTAGAVLAFAYNIPIPIIETNIRTVYLHHFFKDATDVSDKDILQYVERTLPTDDVRTWYYALMDYGVYIKKTYGNQNVRGKGYTKQSSFQGSDRYIRGAIIRMLSKKSASRQSFHRALIQYDVLRVDAQLEKLLREGLIEKHKHTYALP